MTTKSSTKREFCQAVQDDYEEFARRRGQLSGAGKYPAEKYGALTPVATGWRVCIYVSDGRVGRPFPLPANRPLRVTAMTTKPKPDFTTVPLARVQETACGHDCWPIPHPRCGCGIWASTSAAYAAKVVGWSNNVRSWATKLPQYPTRYIAYPVIAHDVRFPAPSPILGKQGDELVARKVEISGPILTIDADVTRSLKWQIARTGFKGQQVGTDIRDLQSHLEALAVTA
ncbi:hypothetical protein [Janibacter indicus]|uniref:hypothetical protein n=1 Tax=Janibacter indicus TaxID=857417 RepID=UPI003D9A9035